MNKPANTSPQIAYLLSFLGVLVDKAGGELVIENLSRYASHNLQLDMKLDAEHDKVTLTVSGGLTQLAADWATVAVCPSCKSDYDVEKKMCISCGRPTAKA